MSVLAEKYLIGYLLMDSGWMDATDNIQKLQKHMFKSPILSDIYEEFLIAYIENREINVVTLQPILQSKGYDEKTSGELLISVVKDLDTSVSFSSCVNSIIDDYKVRMYGEKIRGSVPSSNEVDSAIKNMIVELESLIPTEKEKKIHSICEIVERNKDRYFKDDVDKEKIYFGIKEIDDMVGGMEGGDVVVLAARPSVGKSALALQIIEHNGINGKKVLYMNLEMKESQIYERLISKKSGINMMRIRKAKAFLNDEESKFLTGNKELSFMNNIDVWSGTSSVSDLRSCVKSGNYDFVVIDYLQLLKPDRNRGANRYAEVGDISRGVKEVAMDFNVPIMALSQMNRVSEAKSDHEPTMSELRESGDIEQDATAIVIIWNSDINDRTKKKIKVDKARNGVLGKADLIFNGSTMTFISTDSFVDCEDDTPFD